MDDEVKNALMAKGLTEQDAEFLITEHAVENADDVSVYDDKEEWFNSQAEAFGFNFDTEFGQLLYGCIDIDKMVTRSEQNAINWGLVEVPSGLFVEYSW